MTLPILIVTLVGLFFGIALSIASKVFHVHIDKRIKIREAGFSIKYPVYELMIEIGMMVCVGIVFFF